MRPRRLDEPVDACPLERCGPAPVEVERQQDVAEGVEGGHQVERLEDESDTAAAQDRQLEVGEPGDVGVADPGRPELGASRPAMTCISVDLPEPDGPMMAANSPRRMPTLTPSSACTCFRPCRRSCVSCCTRAARPRSVDESSMLRRYERPRRARRPDEASAYIAGMIFPALPRRTIVASSRPPRLEEPPRPLRPAAQRRAARRPEDVRREPDGGDPSPLPPRVRRGALLHRTGARGEPRTQPSLRRSSRRRPSDCMHTTRVRTTAAAGTR